MRKNLILAIVLLLSLTLLICACDSAEPSDTEAQTDAATEAATEAETEAETETETETETEASPVYKVTVLDENGAPLQDVYVQLCVGELCKLPEATNENGVITFSFEEADYTVKLPLIPDGYSCEAEYSFPAGSTELTITLTKN